jgi:hypothetical protein
MRFLVVIDREGFRLSPEERAGIVALIVSLMPLLNSTNAEVRSDCAHQREELMAQLRSLAIYLWLDQGIADIREL